MKKVEKNNPKRRRAQSQTDCQTWGGPGRRLPTPSCAQKYAHVTQKAAARDLGASSDINFLARSGGAVDAGAEEAPVASCEAHRFETQAGSMKRSSRGARDLVWRAGGRGGEARLLAVRPRPSEARRPGITKCKDNCWRNLQQPRLSLQPAPSQRGSLALRARANLDRSCPPPFPDWWSALFGAVRRSPFGDRRKAVLLSGARVVRNIAPKRALKARIWARDKLNATGADVRREAAF